jgi:hypothetical protein
MAMGSLFYPAFVAIFLGVVFLVFFQFKQKGSMSIRFRGGEGASIQGTLPYTLIILGILLLALDALLPV